jgi:hypothetical protein
MSTVGAHLEPLRNDFPQFTADSGSTPAVGCQQEQFMDESMQEARVSCFIPPGVLPAGRDVKGQDPSYVKAFVRLLYSRALMQIGI